MGWQWWNRGRRGDWGWLHENEWGRNSMGELEIEETESGIPKVPVNLSKAYKHNIFILLDLKQDFRT